MRAAGTTTSLELAFQSADRQAERCLGRPGRYWHAEALVEAGDTSSGLPALKVPLCGGLCAPRCCNDSQVVGEVLPRYVEHAFARMGAPTPTLRGARAVELSRWAASSISFVVAGLAGCGTHHLHRGLASHPDIRLGDHGEHPLFLSAAEEWNSTLPFKSDMDEFRRRQFERQSRVLGFTRPAVVDSARARLALALVPGLVAIVLTCDPMSRLERSFADEYRCPRGAHHQAVRWRRGCARSIAAALERPHLVASAMVGDRLLAMRDSFPGRLVVLHETLLRTTIFREFYADVAAALGLRPFPAEVRLKRNALEPIPRTDLCRNATLVRALQRRLLPEYRRLSQLVHDSQLVVPVDLLIRQTRCPRLQEFMLREDYAGDYVRRYMPRPGQRCAHADGRKLVLLVVGGVMRHFEVAWPLMLRDLVLPNEAAGYTFKIVIHTDLRLQCGASSTDRQCERLVTSPGSRHAFAAHVRQVFSPRAVDLLDFHYPYKSCSRWAQVLEEYAGEACYDHVVAMRPDIHLVDPVTARGKVLDLRAACATHPGFNIISGHFKRKCFFHDRDWDYMALLCDGGYVDLIHDALARMNKRCDCEPGMPPPPLPYDFNPSFEWTCGTGNCDTVRLLHGNIRFGTLDDLVLASFDLSAWGIGLPGHQDSKVRDC